MVVITHLHSFFILLYSVNKATAIFQRGEDHDVDAPIDLLNHDIGHPKQPLGHVLHTIAP